MISRSIVGKLGSALLVGFAVELVLGLVARAVGVFPLWLLPITLVLSPVSIGWLGFPEIAGLSWDWGVIAISMMFALANGVVYLCVVAAGVALRRGAKKDP